MAVLTVYNSQKLATSEMPNSARLWFF